VLDAAAAAAVARIVYVSTVGVFGDTGGTIVDETYRRDLSRGFLSTYDETKFRAHEEAEKRIAAGAPIVIVQPSQVYGPNDHSLTSAQIEHAYAGTLRFVALTSSGVAWVHVDDLAAGMVAALDTGRVGEAYVLSGESLTLKDAIALAARLGGHKPPRLTVPTGLLKLVAPLNDRVGGLPGAPANMREVIRGGDGVTYWAKHDKATAELGFNPRSLEQGIRDTWGPGAAGQSRRID
jgi:dihydroflavonol-4-reductase